MIVKIKIRYLCILLILCACQHSSLNNNDLFVVKVDNLRLRESPNLDAEILTTLKERTKLVDLNEQSTTKSEVVLRGKKLNEYWYRVKDLSSNIDGWVYGGAIYPLKGEYFEDFLATFLSDSLFQLNRIKFPLQGDSSSSDCAENEYYKYNRKNWKMLKIDILHLRETHPELVALYL
ncbi:MAG: hypothetical protein AAF705_07810 [Bacteroidota bacterium]